MPSKKKAKGKARRAKQAAEAQVCRHFGPTDNNWSLDDKNAACYLYEEYISDPYNIANEIYDKYHHLNDAAKDLFRRIVFDSGTEACVMADKEVDLTKEDRINCTDVPILMILTIEVRDQYNRALDAHIWMEIKWRLKEIFHCPRQAVKFFHRRNYCDCLQKIYYNLKENTKRTACCHSCEKIVDIRLLSRCAYCKGPTYCSYECAVADWPDHKENCKEVTKKREENERAKFDAMEKVD